MQTLPVTSLYKLNILLIAPEQASHRLHQVLKYSVVRNLISTQKQSHVQTLQR